MEKMVMINHNINNFLHKKNNYKSKIPRKQNDWRFLDIIEVQEKTWEQFLTLLLLL